MLSVLFFFFKQKTAYEMRISDWSSDVCSSDLENEGIAAAGLYVGNLRVAHRQLRYGGQDTQFVLKPLANLEGRWQIVQLRTICRGGLGRFQAKAHPEQTMDQLL